MWHIKVNTHLNISIDNKLKHVDTTPYYVIYFKILTSTFSCTEMHKCESDFNHLISNYATEITSILTKFQISHLDNSKMHYITVKLLTTLQMKRKVHKTIERIDKYFEQKKIQMIYINKIHFNV